MSSEKKAGNKRFRVEKQDSAWGWIWAVVDKQTGEVCRKTACGTPGAKRAADLQARLMNTSAAAQAKAGGAA